MRLITDPNAFFEELKEREVRVIKPLVIVLLLAAILAIYQYVLATKIPQALPAEIARFFLVGANIGIIGSFIGMFAVWLILAVIMHGISSFFNGKGSFRRTFEFVGYGFFPSLIGSLITIPMSAYYVLNAEIPKISIAQLQQNPDVMKTVILSLVPKSLIHSNLIINFAVTVWSLVIWTFAVKHARDIIKEGFHLRLDPDLAVWSLSNLVDFKAVLTLLFCL